jgi:hypothetical protein
MSFEQAYRKIEIEKKVNKAIWGGVAALGIINIGILTYMFSGLFR